MSTELRKSTNPRITVTPSGKDCAYFSVDGKGVGTAANLAYFEAILSAIEREVAEQEKANK